MMKVVIPTRRSAAEMAPLVDQISETAGVDCQVVVTGVANGSAAVNRNRGLDLIGGDKLVCMVDDDITFRSCGWLKIMLDTLSRSDVVMVSAQLKKPDGSPAYMTGLNDCGGKQLDQGEWVVSTKKLLTACCAFKHNGLRFDEGYLGSGYEDTDYCHQLSEKVPDGKFVVCHSAKVIHANEQKEQKSNWTANKIRYTDKWEPEKLVLKPLVALYKTYRGGEWFEASLESVRAGECLGAVAVTTSEPWKGSPSAPLPENCREPLRRFREAHPEFQVVTADLSGRHGSETQYLVGLEMVKSAFGREIGVLVIDTDEVWDKDALTVLRAEMAADRDGTDYFRSGIWTYLRSPLYRVIPQEKSRVVVGLRSPEVAIGKSRFSDLGRNCASKNVSCSYHHFGYTRLDPEEIISKLQNTESQDKDMIRKNWKQGVWDNLPVGTNLHPTFGCPQHWSSVVEVRAAELPPVTRDNSFWGSLSYHRGGPPVDLLLGDDPAWRTATEAGDHLPTWVRGEFAVPLSSAMTIISGSRVTIDEAAFLVPRLRMSYRETLQLAVLASRVPGGGFVGEVGSGLGGSVAVMGLATRGRGVNLRAVDPYLPYDEENVVTSTDLEVGTPEQFQETLAGLGVEAILSRRSSEDAVGAWEDGLADLTLIDGNHSHDHVARDLRLWWPKLRSGGLMLAHDYSARFPGVVRAVREFEAEVGVRFSLPISSSLAWVVKP